MKSSSPLLRLRHRLKPSARKTVHSDPSSLELLDDPYMKGSVSFSLMFLMFNSKEPRHPCGGKHGKIQVFDVRIHCGPTLASGAAASVRRPGTPGRLVP